ncbi:diguanylate cyclase [Aquibacillus koreensis]|uniref:Diguanylate cyclase n=2 Tax=Aquibacillus koreensis TaxID=279446 RepID=A0A9X3WHF6_9BACI|nr:GGDEF domain-containing protein [Aquibacillus koreensis]MCT2534611.1 diguanylate cyclase [Aquibacillus koreensis]MDC3419795.1 diguanylate cyclase [Aquibacillus koreensis]
MKSLVYFFLENMALIIAFMFITLKAKNFVVKSMTSLWFWLSPFVAGFLSMSVMINGFVYEGMRLDLREVPIFIISYLGGWKVGLLAIIIPSLYRASLMGPTVMEGILQGILLPAVIGSLFYRKNHTILYPFINFRHMLVGISTYELLKSIFILSTTPIPVHIVIVFALFSALVVSVITLMLNDDTQNIKLRKQLEFHSNHDPLTTLPNMRKFNHEVQLLIENKIPYAIAMVDVDYFKEFNDNHGHLNGDHVLQNIGNLLTKSCRGTDIVARYGGEEFIICFSNVSEMGDLSEAAERLRKIVENHSFSVEGKMLDVQVTISIGISFSVEGKALKQVIKEADEALYLSKERGRNCVSYYESSFS